MVVGILLISTVPLYAQPQEQNVAKLKEDARNAVGIIGADRGKTRTYCEIVDLLARQLGQADQEKHKKKRADQEKHKKRADQEKDRKKTRALSQTINQLQKKLGFE